jgi:hypothetical protein
MPTTAVVVVARTELSYGAVCGVEDTGRDRTGGSEAQL